MGAGSPALGPDLWPEPKLSSVLPSVYLSVPENREPEALGTHCFRNCLSLDSTRRVRPFWLPGLGKEDSDRHVSLSSCVSLHLSLCK